MIDIFWCKSLLTVDKAKGFNDIKFSRFILISIVSLYNFLNILFLLVILSALGDSKIVLIIYSYSLYLFPVIWMFWILVVYKRYIINERYKKKSVDKGIKADKRPLLYYSTFTTLTMIIFLLYAVFKS